MSLFRHYQKYRFEIRHFIILFIILAIFQLILSYIYKYSSKNLLEQTMDLYRKDSAIRLANLATTSLELIVEQSLSNPPQTPSTRQRIIQAFDIILNQQTLQQNVDAVGLIFETADRTYVIDDGQKLYHFLFDQRLPVEDGNTRFAEALQQYQRLAAELSQTEQIYCNWDGVQSFHVLVPFVPKGELEGVVYMKITPDVSNITREISSIYDETGVVFLALILFGLLAMFYITSYTVKERDLAQEELFKEREHKIKTDIAHQKEALFTKRIYHAHHKAEKVMGFIKEEIRQLNEHNIPQFKYVVTRYANFISRVIYDMKWYEPPVHATRNPLFQTDINKVIQFLVDYIFRRVYAENSAYNFILDLDENLPPVQINEYVVWEILEPLIQNSIDHNPGQNVTITLQTRYYPEQQCGEIRISDNGKGIVPELLESTPEGIKKIFLENTSTRANSNNAGYGCYIAYELVTKRCGWHLEVENLPAGGCLFTIRFKTNT